ncbi:MAG TPA: cob(I)yrinic acid a,c-diamide adenosyltransferase [Acholeplasmataceae bacterium]|jgi:cob(I)alamin adenosyltransferase|nr:cob(I)yrinic acid a,c-diamide adenosyltransferase [Acholeplasmataceae bacterium]
MNKGYIHVYTGNGKGKTTACFGLAIRALGAGKKVFLGQFMKGIKDSAFEILEKLDNLEIKMFGAPTFVGNDPKYTDIEKAKEGYEYSLKVLKSGEYDVVILDELNLCFITELITEEEFHTLIDAKPEHVELIITGRYATNFVKQRADLVTEMRELKHYYHEGVLARRGIDF